MGRVRTIGLGCSRCLIKDSNDDLNDAPGRSSLLRNISLVGTLYLEGQWNQRSKKEIEHHPHLSNCFHTPFVCASTPSTESMSTTAPSTTRLALSTSIPKSACPGVSIRLNVQSFHFTGILADWMVIPRSLSAGKKSVVVLPVSTDPAAER